MELSFPFQDPSEFSCRPHLVGSRRDSDPGWTDHLRHISGSLEPGSEFVLATDALAHWFLSSDRAKEKPWAELNRVATNDDFARLVKDLRGAGRLRNDDCTMVRWRV